MLEKAIALAKAGDEVRARNLLRQNVTEEPDNERAWGWLAYCAETNAERREGLEQVLEINPDNEAVRRALEKLGEEEPAKEKLLSPEAERPPQKEQPTPDATIEQIPEKPDEQQPPTTIQEPSLTGRYIAIVGNCFDYCRLISPLDFSSHRVRDHFKGRHRRRWRNFINHRRFDAGRTHSLSTKTRTRMGSGDVCRLCHTSGLI